jgi:hypothetical protein
MCPPNAPVDLVFQQAHSTQLFAAFESLTDNPTFSRLRIAVAFATRSGVRLLLRALDKRGGGLDVKVLVSTDAHITEPDALDLLRNDPRIEVRVFRSPPDTMLHAKVFYFDGQADASVLLGSSNLSAAAFTKNREAGVTVGLGATGSPEFEAWWDVLWNLGLDCDAQLVADYRARYTPAPHPPPDRQTVVTPEPLNGGVENAQLIWLGTGSMTGGGVTQLELPRPIVGFFGFDPSVIAAEHQISLVRGAQAWPGNRVVFYENAMWRVNLAGNIPEVLNRTLPYSYVVFERTAQANVFEFRVLSDANTQHLRSASQALGQMDSTPTRDYGWL